MTVESDPQAVAWLQGRCESLTEEAAHLRGQLAQAQRYATAMERQRNAARTELAQALHHAGIVDATNQELLGQVEDMRSALATAEALDRTQVENRWVAIWDRCG